MRYFMAVAKLNKQKKRKKKKGKLKIFKRKKIPVLLNFPQSCGVRFLLMIPQLEARTQVPLSIPFPINLF